MSTAGAIERLVRRACDETAPSVDEEAMRALKRAAKSDENALRCAHETLMRLISSTRSTAATRAHAVTATSELFARSRLFRELTMDGLEVLMKHAIGTDSDIALPDVPKGEADRLRQHAIDVLDDWVRKFKDQYKQLPLARKFVTERLGDEAPEVRAERARAAAAEKEREAQRNLQRRWLDAKEELPGLLSEVRETLHVAGECFHMLFGDSFEATLDEKRVSSNDNPSDVDKPSSMPADGETEDDWEDVKDGAVTEWRFAEEFKDGSASTSAVSTTGIAIRETDENAPIIEQLRGLYRSTRARYLSQLGETLQILGRIQPDQLGDNGVVVITQNERLRTVNVVGDLKQLLSAFLARCDALRLVRNLGGDSFGADANANATTASVPKPVEAVDEVAESRGGASTVAMTAFLERAQKRRKRSVSDVRREQKEKSEGDIAHRAQKMLASQIRAHNDEVLAEAGVDFFELERRRQNVASETLANEMMDEEIERRNERAARGRTARQRIESRLRQLKRGRR